jgi:NADH-quinone oxidoreductase subunit A
MIASFIPVLMVLGIAALFSLAFLRLSSLLGPQRPNALKATTYECGIPPRASTDVRFFVRFFLIALLFLLFDLEAVFLYPWVILFRSFVAHGRAAFALGELGLFLGVLVAGYAYVWRKGGLEWQ